MHVCKRISLTTARKYVMIYVFALLQTILSIGDMLLEKTSNNEEVIITVHNTHSCSSLHTIHSLVSSLAAL